MTTQYVNRPRYAFPISSGIQVAPAASTTYYFSNVQAAPGINSGVGRIYVPMTSTIQIVVVHTLTGVVGSGETGEVYLRINATDDYLISSGIRWNLTLGIWFNAAPLMSDEVTPFDFFEIKVVTPAWVTPPTSVLYWGTILFSGAL